MKTLLAVGALGFAVFSLAQAMFSMARGPDESGAMVGALTRRMIISVLLFAGLMLSWRLGWIEPHGVQ